MSATEFDPQRFSRGLYELAVLGVLHRKPMHGYEISIEVAERTAGLFILQHGTLYPVLHRLEKAGLVKGRWSGGEGQRRRKEYSLTVRGRSHLQKEAAWSRTIFESLFDVLGDVGAKRLRASS